MEHTQGMPLTTAQAKFVALTLKFGDTAGAAVLIALPLKQIPDVSAYLNDGFWVYRGQSAPVGDCPVSSFSALVASVARPDDVFVSPAVAPWQRVRWARSGTQWVSWGLDVVADQAHLSAEASVPSEVRAQSAFLAAAGRLSEAAVFNCARGDVYLGSMQGRRFHILAATARQGGWAPQVVDRVSSEAFLRKVVKATGIAVEHCSFDECGSCVFARSTIGLLRIPVTDGSVVGGAFHVGHSPSAIDRRILPKVESLPKGWKVLGVSAEGHPVLSVTSGMRVELLV